MHVKGYGPQIKILQNDPDASFYEVKTDIYKELNRLTTVYTTKDPHTSFITTNEYSKHTHLTQDRCNSKSNNEIHKELYER